MHPVVRAARGLVAIGAATAVGITTREPGFTALTFIGVMALPRILGFGGGHRWAGGCLGRGDRRARLEQRLSSWHRQAHGEHPADVGVVPS